MSLKALQRRLEEYVMALLTFLRQKKLMKKVLEFDRTDMESSPKCL